MHMPNCICQETSRKEQQIALATVSQIAQRFTLSGIQGSLAAHHDDFLAPVLTERPDLSAVCREDLRIFSGCEAAHELQLACLSSRCRVTCPFSPKNSHQSLGPRVEKP